MTTSFKNDKKLWIWFAYLWWPTWAWGPVAAAAGAAVANVVACNWARSPENVISAYLLLASLIHPSKPSHAATMLRSLDQLSEALEFFFFLFSFGMRLTPPSMAAHRSNPVTNRAQSIGRRNAKRVYRTRLCTKIAPDAARLNDDASLGLARGRGAASTWLNCCLNPHKGDHRQI